jgi:hypothetical protein
MNAQKKYELTFLFDDPKQWRREPRVNSRGRTAWSLREMFTAFMLMGVAFTWSMLMLYGLWRLILFCVHHLHAGWI